MLLQLPWFFPFSLLHPAPPLPQAVPPPLFICTGHVCKFFGLSLSPPQLINLHSLRQSPHHCSCPWVMSVSSLAAPFPVLYFTSHGYSVTTYLYFLIPSPLHPFSPIPLPSGDHLVTKFFSVAAFKSLSLSLNFGILILMYLGVGLFVSILFGTLCLLSGLACLFPSPN